MEGFKRTSFTLFLCVVTLLYISYIRYNTGESVGWFLTFVGVLLVFAVSYLVVDIKDIIRNGKKRKWK